MDVSSEQQLALPLDDDAMARHLAFTISAPLDDLPDHAVDVSLRFADGRIEVTTSSWRHGGGTTPIDLLEWVGRGGYGFDSSELASLCARFLGEVIYASWPRSPIRANRPSVLAIDQDPDWKPISHALVLAFRDLDARRARLVTPTHPRVRRALYDALHPSRDAHRRVEQLVAGQPMLAALVAYASATTAAGAGVRLWSLVTDGAPTRLVVDTVANALLLDSAASARLRWLARRLPGAADPADVALVARSDVPASDVPADMSGQLVWASTLAFVLRAASDESQWMLSAEQLRAVARQASRHYLSMASAERDDLRRTFRCLEWTARVPPRDHDRRALHRWVERAFEDAAVGIADTLDLRLHRIPETFAPAPFPEWEAEDARITAITSRTGLISEGRSMRHCVITHGAELGDGGLAIYHASIDGAESTFMIAQAAEGRWQIMEHRGPHNAAVSRRARHVVARWLRRGQKATTATTTTTGNTQDANDPFAWFEQTLESTTEEEAP